MSADPEAILFYGFPLPTVDDYHEMNTLWEQSHRPAEPNDKSNYRSAEWDEWRGRVRKWEKSLENVQIDWSGGEDCEQYYVHCEGIEKSVEWNELRSINENDAAAVPEATRWIHEFCDRFNLPKDEPKWHLAARYF